MTRVIGKGKNGRKQYEYDWFYHSKAWSKLGVWHLIGITIYVRSV